MLKIKLVLLCVAAEERNTSCGDPLVMRNFCDWDMQVITLKMYVCEQFCLLLILYMEMYQSPHVSWK